MATTGTGPVPGFRPAALDGDLLLRETMHRCGNDLQLVASLLTLQSRRVTIDEARDALRDAADRVAVLARARAAMTQQRTPDLAAAIDEVCRALRPHAEARGIAITLRVERAPGGMTVERITAVALVVNELMTNALKHAFRDGVSGTITVAIGRSAAGDVAVTVDDDGLPYPDADARRGGGLGLGLARRLMASIDGLLIPPSNAGKKFELRAPSSPD